jgi:predicted transcriptional regulator
MHHKKNLVVLLTIFLLSVLFSAHTAAASPLRFDVTTTIGLTIAAIIAAVATIAGYLVAGGVKYVTPENVLDTEIRKNLYEYIDEYPGSHLREIARELAIKPSNAAWHLRKLEQTNLVRSRYIGGKKVFYLVEGGIEARKRAVAESILRNNNARKIMQYLLEEPGKHLLEIAHALDLNHHVVKWHIKKMHMAELVEGDTSNSTYPVYYPTEIGSSALEEFEEYIKKTGYTAS